MSQEHDSTKVREFKHLSKAEREIIEKQARKGSSIGAIARLLDRDKRTISRELKRGQVMHRKENPYASRNPQVPDYIDEPIYQWDVGEGVYKANRMRSVNKRKLVKCAELIQYVEGKILCAQKWSPDAAIGYAVANNLFADTISTKTFYNYVDEGLCKVKAIDLLLKVKRKPRSHAHKNKKKLGMSIEERPAVVSERKEFGHWEGDGIVGKDGQGQIITLVERTTRVGFMFNAGDRKADKVVGVLDQLQERYGERFSALFKTITFDNGTEFSSCEEMQKDGRTKVYYAHPYSSFERGTNENWNGIVRRFIPKGKDFSDITDELLARVMHFINTMPRRCLGYKTPLDLWNLSVDAILAS
jgi:IS30 family transposase